MKRALGAENFDCVHCRQGALDSQKIINGGASSARDTLSQHDIYLSITAHHNLNTMTRALPAQSNNTS